MSGWSTAHLDGIAAGNEPAWAPIRSHFGIGAFGVNAWRGCAGDEVIERHDEAEDGHEELYLVLSGHATFEVAGEQVDAPAGTLVFVGDPGLERAAVATVDGTAVLALGGWADRAFQPSEWETSALGG